MSVSATSTCAFSDSVSEIREAKVVIPLRIFGSVVVRAGGVDIHRAKFCLRALREAVSSSTTCDNLYLRPLSGHDYNIVSL